MIAPSPATRTLLASFSMLWLCSCGKTTETPALAEATGQTLTIMSANTTSGNRQRFGGPGERIFQALRPDIVAIQEFNVPDPGGPRAWVERVFGKDFHFMVEPGRDSIPCGIVSRFPITASGEWNDPQVGNRDFAWATIDIPGAIDLHIISVHLHGSGRASSRKIEAEVIVAAAKKSFPKDDYLVLCGDFNTRTRKEAAIAVFRRHFSDRHIPVDQVGNSHTSKNRNYAYDWVMPNPRLDQLHQPLKFGAREFPEGLVFDTRLWQPPPAPALNSDSTAPGMQHMAVIKAFRLPDVATEEKPEAP